MRPCGAFRDFFYLHLKSAMKRGGDAINLAIAASLTWFVKSVSYLCRGPSLSATLMLAAAAYLCQVTCFFAVLAAIFVILRDRTTATRMRALIIVCHFRTFFPQRQPGESGRSLIFLKGESFNAILGGYARNGQA